MEKKTKKILVGLGIAFSILIGSLITIPFILGFILGSNYAMNKMKLEAELKDGIELNQDDFEKEYNLKIR